MLRRICFDLTGLPPSIELQTQFFNDPAPTSEAAARRHGLTPIARILGGATAGVPPRIMGIGPAPASQKLIDRLGLTQGDFDVIELNEAFASQSLAVIRSLELNPDLVNVNGGAMALGHPIGATGANTSAQYPAVLNMVAGTRFKIILGYPGGADINLAMEKGEVDARGSNSWTVSSFKARRALPPSFRPCFSSITAIFLS